MTFFEDGYPNDRMLSVEDLDEEDWPDADELDNNLFNGQDDVGHDSAEEEHIWICPGC